MANKLQRRVRKARGSIDAESSREAVIASAKAQIADSDATLKAGRAALDRTKDALAKGRRSKPTDVVEMPVALTSQTLREYATKARIARDPVVAEKYEMAARRLDMRGPREIAAGKYVPARTSQGKTKRFP